ncbi:hypothetical protein MP213Fo_28140 [Pseudochrobactrum sp. MP213Fo]
MDIIQILLQSSALRPPNLHSSLLKAIWLKTRVEHSAETNSNYILLYD